MVAPGLMAPIFRPQKILTYQTSVVQTATTSTPTFSSVSIGTAANSRRVIVHFSTANQTKTVSSATIQGITADIIQTGQSGNGTGALIIAHVPTGTTADIVITLSGNTNGSGIGVWTATGLTSNTPNDSDMNVTSGTSQAVTVAGLAGGFIVAGHTSANGTNQTTTWTNVSQQYDEEFWSSRYHSGGDAATAAAGDVTVTGAVPSGSANITIAAAW